MIGTECGQHSFDMIHTECWLEFNYLCYHCPSPLMLWVWMTLRRGVLNASCDKVCPWHVGGFLRVLSFPPPALKLIIPQTKGTDIKMNPPYIKSPFVCKFYFILIFLSTYPYAYTLPSVENVFTKNSLCIMTEFINHKCAIRLLQHCLLSAI
jgi:hypothetical protein